MISDLIYEAFLWLDESKGAYWIVAWVCFGAFLLTSLWPYEPGRRGRRWNHPWLYLATLGLAMFAFRWPLMAAPVEFNPDESQLLAGAITAWHRHIVWSIDVGYCGPWSFLPLTLPAVFGFPIDYLGGRCVALLMTGASVVLVWSTLRRIFNDRTARLGILPLAGFYVLSGYEDFVRYSGEQSSQLYFCLALWLLVLAFEPAHRTFSRTRLLLGGFMLGMLPFSKLQSSPLGVMLGGLALVAIFLRTGRSWGERTRDAASLVAGVFLSVGLTLGSIVASGAWFHFYKSYLVTGFAYTGMRSYPNSELFSWVWRFAVFARGLAPFLGTACAAILLALPLVKQMTAVPRFLLALGGLLVLTGIFVVWAPGRMSHHYLLFLVVPLGFLLAVLYGGLLTRPGQSRTAHGAWFALFLGLTVAPQIYARYDYGVPSYVGTLFASRHKPDRLIRLLKLLIQPGDSMTVWGWSCNYHVLTQLPQGTREAHTERQIEAGPELEYFRARFLADLARERPVFFLDAVGPSTFHFTDRDTYAHDLWPELHALVSRDYVPIGERDHVRIFLRRDRQAEQAAELQRLREAGF